MSNMAAQPRNIVNKEARHSPGFPSLESNKGRLILCFCHKHFFGTNRAQRLRYCEIQDDDTDTQIFDRMCSDFDVTYTGCQWPFRFLCHPKASSISVPELPLLDDDYAIGSKKVKAGSEPIMVLSKQYLI